MGHAMCGICNSEPCRCDAIYSLGFSYDDKIQAMQKNMRDKEEFKRAFEKKGDKEKDMISKNRIKRFIIFAGYHYYPEPGVRDIYGHYDTFEEVNSAISDMVTDDKTWDWLHVLDTDTGKALVRSDDGALENLDGGMSYG